MGIQSRELQSWTSLFSRFSTISFYYKWHGTKLLSPESECRVAGRLKTEDPWKLENFKKFPEIVDIDECTVGLPKNKYWQYTWKISRS